MPLDLINLTFCFLYALPPIKDTTSYVRVKDSLASGDVIKSDNIRQDNPSVSIAQSTTLTEGNNQFAFELYRQIKDSPSNLLFPLQHLASAGYGHSQR